jgi:hypothetical protein
MATLTVNVSGSGWEMIGGKLVGPETVTSTYRIVTGSYTLCPSGSSQPRSVEEAMWYWNNLGSMIPIEGSDIYDEDGHHTGLGGVIWQGAQVVSSYNSLGLENIFTSSCVWNGRVLSGENFVEVDGRYMPYGQIYSWGGSNEGHSFIIGFRCIVW